MELRQWLNWGMSMSYEFTLGDWMLSKIINKIVEGGTQSCIVVWGKSRVRYIEVRFSYITVT